MKNDITPMGVYRTPMDVYNELMHTSQSYYASIFILQRGEQPNISTREVFCPVLQKYIDGTYQYEYTKAFNPVVAKELLDRTKKILAADYNGILTYEHLDKYVKELNKILDAYAKETGIKKELDETEKLRDELFGKL